MAVRWEYPVYNIDNASRICHSPSKTALKRSVGIAASSCNYRDWIGTDVIVFWGSVAANNQPVSTKYMKYAGIPDYNIACVVEKAEQFHARKDTQYLEKPVEDLELDVS